MNVAYTGQYDVSRLTIDIPAMSESCCTAECPSCGTATGYALGFETCERVDAARTSDPCPADATGVGRKNILVSA